MIVFSPVYSKRADGPFIDQSPSMLNVATSRAKNSFLVFGDMDAFKGALPNTPRNQLAQLLLSDGANELRFEFSITSRPYNRVRGGQPTSWRG